ECVDHKIAARSETLHTVLSHRPQVLVARDQVDFGTSSVQRGTPVGADRSGTDHCNAQGDSAQVDTVCTATSSPTGQSRPPGLVAYSMRSNLLWQWSPPRRCR